jgi:hypothetical protein
MFVVDVMDTLLKGREYYSRHALAYDVRAAIYFALCLLAIKIRRPWFHAFFAVFAVVYETAYILLMYRSLS